jgi:hypothetical protein
MCIEPIFNPLLWIRIPMYLSLLDPDPVLKKMKKNIFFHFQPVKFNFTELEDIYFPPTTLHIKGLNSMIFYLCPAKVHYTFY